MKDEIRTLKSDSVLDVFQAAVSGSNLTRADIAEKCGLSVMTVGKAVDALVALKVLKQSMSGDISHGRRSRTVNISSELWCAEYIIGDRGYSFYMTDLSLRTIDVMHYNRHKNIFVDDEFNAFSNRVIAFAKERRREDKCCGTAVLMPSNVFRSMVTSAEQNYGYGFAPESLFPVSSCFNRRPLWGMTRDYHARWVSSFANGKNVFCLYINPGDIKAVHTGGGKGESIPFSEAGLFIGSKSKMNLNDMTMSDCDPQTFCETLAEYLCTCVLCVPFDLILLSGDNIRHLDAVRDVTCAIFDDYCMKLGVIPPEMRCENIRDGSAAAAAAELRDKWFADEILGC